MAPYGDAPLLSNESQLLVSKSKIFTLSEELQGGCSRNLVQLSALAMYRPCIPRTVTFLVHTLHKMNSCRDDFHLN